MGTFVCCERFLRTETSVVCHPSHHARAYSCKLKAAPDLQTYALHRLTQGIKDSSLTPSLTTTTTGLFPVSVHTLTLTPTAATARTLEFSLSSFLLIYAINKTHFWVINLQSTLWSIGAGAFVVHVFLLPGPIALLPRSQVSHH